MTSVHSRDITLALNALVKTGFLESDGMGKGTFYFFPNERPESRISSDGFFSDVNSDHLSVNSDCLESNSDRLSVNSDRLESNSDRLNVNSDHWRSLMTIAEPVSGKRKVSKDVFRGVILALCQEKFLTQRQLSELLVRSPHTLRNGYLSEMILSHQLELKYPDIPNHPQQAYRSLLEKE
jgi:ATP-dependent DNA helicase RecG